MKKLLIGIFLSTGFVFLAVTASVFFTKNPSEKDKSAALGGLIIGVPATAAGGWLMWELRRHKQRLQQARELEIETIFLQQLTQNNGNMTAISFALATKLPLEESKKYLDTKSTQLNCAYNIDERGGASYHFEL